MNLFRALAAAIVVVALPAATAFAQAPAAAAAPTDVYHVHIAKAVPGQAAALAAQLMELDPKNPMASHFLMLRHAEGDDWDYMVISHVGPKATVEITPTPTPAPAAAPALTAWHADTFVSGPSWPEFSKMMGVAAGAPAGSVYVAAMHRAVPGHRAQLAEILVGPPGGKIPVSHLTLAHLEGGPWTFLSLDRYNSWADFAADRETNGAVTSSGDDGWSQTRQHSAYHTDTVATRVIPKQ
jgi:hypothetical protein